MAPATPIPAAAVAGATMSEDRERERERVRVGTEREREKSKRERGYCRCSPPSPLKRSRRRGCCHSRHAREDTVVVFDDLDATTVVKFCHRRGSPEIAIAVGNNRCRCYRFSGRCRCCMWLPELLPPYLLFLLDCRLSSGFSKLRIRNSYVAAKTIRVGVMVATVVAD
ncbi:hypothetical protein PIB30_051221 [Stylosanthes scabra]|uniref:Uncharacterized protein n=1 Tax=Stylosanthes scabra TaxID=79078 RepID=A0ABU6SHR6_9FABA|nr:hypothetical protein [Stylosanthes scabra]